MFFLGAWHLTTHVVDMVDFVFVVHFCQARAVWEASMSMRSLVFQMLVNQLDSWTQMDKATLKKLQKVLFEEYSVLIPGDMW